ncbi:MAG: FxsA family protein [Planctomycetes bacterium]|nr:FxsA family protein [Planctomycetota bacterium]
MLLWLFLLFTLVPMLELALLLELGGRVGVLPTVAFVAGAGMLGAWLARRQGVRAVQTVRLEMAAGRMPTDALLDGLLVLVGAVLLITPGVLTDALGLALLLPPVRRGIRRLLKKWVAARMHLVVVSSEGAFEGAGPRAGRKSPSVILDAEVIPTKPTPAAGEPRDPPGANR